MTVFVQVYGVLELEAGMALVLELAPGGSLWSTLQAADGAGPAWGRRVEVVHKQSGQLLLLCCLWFQDNL